MNVQKNDFIEVEFTGKMNDEIFDTTNSEEAKSIGLQAKVRPTIACVGKEMILKGLDDELEGKEIGKKYLIHLMPDQAFGKRNTSLIKIIPIRVFKEKDMNPVKGMVFQFDNQMARIISVSGGRVTADFNNPLAGKEVDYDIKINKKITDDKEKINAIQDFFFRQRFEFDLDKENKKVIFKETKLKPIIDIFTDKFKEISGFDVEVIENDKHFRGPQKSEISKVVEATTPGDSLKEK
jgi:FKBP-type peptidyl-prolyl cis-trans isomerase 2